MAFVRMVRSIISKLKIMVETESSFFLNDFVTVHEQEVGAWWAVGQPAK